ncbi:hypothetical protein EGJ27_18085 [Pseudomonas sp. v388]|nr:hypothetical protein EGJ27_18085 [Pseudomonas sp. v388]
MQSLRKTLHGRGSVGPVGASSTQPYRQHSATASETGFAPLRFMMEISKGKTRQNGAEPLESAHCARQCLPRHAWPPIRRCTVQRQSLSACLANPGPMLLSGFLMPAICCRSS